MDILYVVGNGSTWKNNELRYSLRSIAKHGRNIDRVYLVGAKPDFVSNRVHFLPCNDPYDRKHKNILHKVLKAVEKTDIGNHFLISSDDHFYAKDVDFDNLPIYYRNEEIPASYPAEKLTNSYNRSLLQTRSLLLKYGLPIYQTNPHCNTHFRKDIYKANKYLFDEAITLEDGGEMNCIMGNLFVLNGVVPQPFKDSKLSKDKYKDRKTFMERIKDQECFSMADKSLEWGIGDYLATLFPEKCIYEI